MPVTSLPELVKVLSTSAGQLVLRICNGCINLAQEVFIGKMLQEDRSRRTFSVAEAVSFTENRIYHGFIALFSLPKLDCIIGAG